MSKKRFARFGAAFLAAVLLLTTAVTTVFAEVGDPITVNIRFMDGNTFVSGGDYPMTEGVHNYSELASYVPEGYELTMSGDFYAKDGDKMELSVEKTVKNVVVNIRFMDGDTFVSGGDYPMTEGVHNYSELASYVPEGYEMTVSGDFYVEEGSKIEVSVEKIVKDVVVNIRFMDGDTFVAGGDYFLTEGVHNYSELVSHVPEGYEMTVSGDFMVVEGGSLDVPVAKDYTIINVVFKSTGGKNLGGGDFVVDADGDGVANYNELPLPDGYELTETGDFFVQDGNSYVITLKKIVEGTIINVQFVDSTTGEVVAGGDYFVDNDDDGIANYNELPVPEGYLLQVVGDFFVNPNETMVVMVDQVIPGTIINVVYKSEGGKSLGGGDFVVDKDGDGVANYSELPLPEGYELIVTGDFQVEEGKSYTIILKKTIEGTIINVVFVDENNENLGGGDFVVDKDDDGVANYSELPLPEGYELIETGDFFVEAGKSYTIVLKKTAADPSDPTDPTDPTDPSDPTDPENPEKPADTNTDKETNTDTPKTGESLPVAAAATMIVAAGAMYVVYRKKVSLQK